MMFLLYHVWWLFWMIYKYIQVLHEFFDSPFNKTRAAPGQALASKPPFGQKTRAAGRGSHARFEQFAWPSGPLYSFLASLTSTIWNPRPWLFLSSSLSSVNCHLSIVKNAEKSLKSCSNWMCHHEHMAYSERVFTSEIHWFTMVHLHFFPQMFAPKLAITQGPQVSNCSDEADSSISTKLESSCQCCSTSSWWMWGVP